MLAPPETPPPPRPPDWAMTLVGGSGADIKALDAAFAAGAALSALDVAVRQNAPFAGAWRARLALKAAVANLRGRAGDETSLRDAFALTRPGGDPGPAGRVYAAWRTLSAGGTRRLAEIAAGLGASDLGALSALLDLHTHSAAPAPLAAAAMASAASTAFPRVTPLAFADLVLAARLGWRAPVPLLALEVLRACPQDPAWTAACCAAYTRAAARACDLHAELARATKRLQAVAPKLRAKGAHAAITALLDDDAVSSATQISGLSDRGLRACSTRSSTSARYANSPAARPSGFTASRP